MEPMMTGSEVAGLLRVSLATVYRLAARGELPAHKVGRVWRFQREAIANFALKSPGPSSGDASRAGERGKET
ncbi:MAG: helix-turn-helix domain-containing protein [Phycisphaerae bacterium]|jgi:excisionase family DNA binding protein